MAQPARRHHKRRLRCERRGVASWLFVGAEYAIPISKDVRKHDRNILWA